MVVWTSQILYYSGLQFLALKNASCCKNILSYVHLCNVCILCSMCTVHIMRYRILWFVVSKNWNGKNTAFMTIHIWHLLSHKHAQVLYASYSSISLWICMAKIYLGERVRSIQVNGKAKKTEAAFSGFWLLWYFSVSARLERCLSFVAPHMLLLFQPLYSAVPLQSSSAASHFLVSDFFSVTAYLFSGLHLIQSWARESFYIKAFI